MQLPRRRENGIDVVCFRVEPVHADDSPGIHDRYKMGDYISDAEIIEDRGTESMTRRPSVEEGMMLAAISVQAILLCFLLTAEVSSGIPLTSTTEPRENNGSLIPKDDDSWHKYVRAPPSKNIAPQSIVLESITGKVINPQGMISGTGPTTFTRSNEDDIRPSLIVDFGQNVVGYLTLKLRGTKLDQSTTALPGLRIAFSETLQNLASGRSDFTRSDNADTGDVGVLHFSLQSGRLAHLLTDGEQTCLQRDGSSKQYLINNPFPAQHT